ncbi:hypothetical protein [Saccharopolyspora endophytica]|uniref:Glycosyltransferase RgtA/B/C/D-like domain-containing protein n=1 Tax=Saccharopolyspora endophytica TaxID=543886 RepID=A0ABS5DDK6_9PSEU|nr:hypothetical protein [Saccharopolyspora endophytica]MBQ0924356.1 hypothetical protein [Saccharopolyspora endophytica]
MAETLADRSAPARSLRTTLRHRSAWAPILSVGCGTALIAVHARAYGSWLIDDAAITFAYARNLGSGAGLVLQPGAMSVEGYSNPTWLVLLALGRALGLFDSGTLFGIPDYVVYPKLLALICCAGVLVCTYLAARPLTSRAAWAPLVAGAVLAALPSFVIWNFSGLENPLYALITAALAVLLLRARLAGTLLHPGVAAASGALAVLAAMTRPDGAVLAAAFPLLAACSARSGTIRAISVSCASFMVPFGLFAAWRFVHFGLLVPNTAVAKGGIALGAPQLERLGELLAYPGWPATAAFLLGVVSLVLRRDQRAALPALLIPLALAVVAYTLLPEDWMSQHRFATPVWTLAALTTALVVTAGLAGHRRRWRVALVLAVVVAGLVGAPRLHRDAAAFRAAPDVPLCSVAERYGHVPDRYADLLGLRSGTLLVPDVGGTALTSRLRIVDLAGLTDPAIAEHHRHGDMRGLRDHVFDRARPTIIHAHGHWSAATGILGDPRLARDYVLVHADQVLAPNQDWIRREAVPDPGLLAALRAEAGRRIDEINHRDATAPDRTCGPVLRVGR